MAGKHKRNKGISMIVVLWIMAILTVLTTATALMTQGDVASTINLIKRKGALQLAESGSDYLISMIPDNSMIDSLIDTTGLVISEDLSDTTAYHAESFSSDRTFILTPVPMVYNNAFGINPYGPVSPGGAGSYYVYDFQVGGMMGLASEVRSPQRTVEVSAGWWTPLGESAFGHTMY
jgi:hypothetical protein